MDKDLLLSKKCRECEVGGIPIPGAALGEYLKAVDGWELIDGIKIKKEFKFDDFIGSMKFANEVAVIAEDEGHHPAIFISYNKVRITLSTHAVGGLTENDFIVAAKIDQVNT